MYDSLSVSTKSRKREQKLKRQLGLKAIDMIVIQKIDEYEKLRMLDRSMGLDTSLQLQREFVDCRDADEDAFDLIFRTCILHLEEVHAERDRESNLRLGEVHARTDPRAVAEGQQVLRHRLQPLIHLLCCLLRIALW